MAAVTAVASVVTPTVVPTALTHQKTAIARAAIVLANNFPGDTGGFMIRSICSTGFTEAAR